MNEELKRLFDNYKTLDYDQVVRLISFVVKEEKDKSKLSFPVRIGFNPNSENASGNCQLVFDEKSKQKIYKINFNIATRISNFLQNQNKTYTNSSGLNFDNGMDSLFYLVADVCHEMRHAYQFEQTLVRKDISDIKALVWVKEIVAMSDELYKENYAESFMEQDAYSYMYNRALTYIDSYTNVKQANSRFYAELQKPAQIQQQKSKEIVDTTFMLSGVKRNAIEVLNEEFEKVKATMPSANFQNSILRYEYNPSGTRKTYEELMEAKESQIAQIDKKAVNHAQQVAKINNIYQSIIQFNKLVSSKAIENQSSPLSPSELFFAEREAYGKYAVAIENLMKNKNNYPEAEYNQRLERLIISRDASQRKMSIHFKSMPPNASEKKENKQSNNQQQVQVPPLRETHQEKAKLQLIKEEILEEKQRRRFDVNIDPKLQAEILNSMFTDSGTDSNNEINEQVEHRRAM